jgi:hypothetical protein
MIVNHPSKESEVLPRVIASNTFISGGCMRPIAISFITPFCSGSQPLVAKQ